MNKEIKLSPCDPGGGRACDIGGFHFHWSWPQQLESGKSLLHTGVFVMAEPVTLFEFDALLMQHAGEVVDDFWDTVKARRQWVVEEVAGESNSVTVREAGR